MLKSIFSTATFKQSQITVAGTILNGGLGALFYIILARFLGPSDFGLLTIALTTMVLVADIADIGTNTGLIRFVSKNLAENEQVLSRFAQNKDQAYKFLKLCLEIKLITWLISLLGLFFLAPFLAETVFHKVSLILPLRLAGFGVGAALLFTYATASLQAYQKYFAWSFINILSNFLRLISIIFLGYYIQLNVESGLLVYIIFPLFGFFVALLILPARKIIQAKKEFSLSAELFKYNVPVAIFTIMAAFSSKLDTYLTAALLSSKEVGIYGAATQLVAFMPQLVSALGLVSSPKFASYTSNKEMLLYFKKFQLLVLGLVVLGILAIPFFIFIIPIVLGMQYQEVTLPFVILFLAMLIFLFSIPVHHSVIFYFGRPDVFIWVSVGHLLIIGGLGYLMISNFGVVGAAVTVLAGTTFNFLAPAGWLLLKIKK